MPTNIITPDQDFDWESLERSCPKYRRKNKIYNSVDIIYDKDPQKQQQYLDLIESTEALIKPSTNSIVEGCITDVNNRYAYLDIGWRESAILDMHKESPEYKDNFVKGATMEVLLKSVDLTSNTGSISASYTEVVKHLKHREIHDSIGKRIAFPAKVKELIHGGYFLDIDGVEVFMPGSLGGVNKLVNFDRLLGKEIYVVPINYAKDKDYIVVSHRDYLQSLIPDAIEDLNAGDGKSGFITGTTKFGIFCEFDNCLTGLVHKSDLDDETQQAFNDRSLKPGDEIKFVIKEVTRDNRIMLSQLQFVPEIDPWDNIGRYTIPSQVQGTIRKKTKYGMFIELEPKIVGLLHISDIPDYIDLAAMKEGDLITVDLIKIDVESKKIFFKI